MSGPRGARDWSLGPSMPLGLRRPRLLRRVPGRLCRAKLHLCMRAGSSCANLSRTQVPDAVPERGELVRVRVLSRMRHCVPSPRLLAGGCDRNLPDSLRSARLPLVLRQASALSRAALHAPVRAACVCRSGAAQGRDQADRVRVLLCPLTSPACFSEIIINKKECYFMGVKCYFF